MSTTRESGNRAAELSRAAVNRIRRSTHAEGAGESGLGKLIELNASGSAGDALVAVALAGTLFFAVPTGEARGRVALYLLVTMAPFSVVAPVIGPVLDRFRRGRRYALATTMLARAFVAWFMASAIAAHHDALGLYPGAFAILVLSRAYGVSRSAVLPRLLPRGGTLVRANARVSLAGTIAGLAVGALGAGVTASIGPKWSLRFAALVFVAGAVLALQLPAHADSAVGEESLPALPQRRAHPQAQVGHPGERAWWAEPEEDLGAAPPPPAESGRVTDVTARGIGPAVASALRANAALRAYGGFLTVYLAFLVRTHDFGPPRTVALGFVALGVGTGAVGGQTLGARMRGRPPERLILLALMASTGLAILTGLLYSLVTLIIVAFVAGVSQSIAKLSLDSVIQQQVAEEVRTSAFARSETLLQISFVGGGAVGLLPITPHVALLGAAVGLAVVLVDAMRRQHALRAGS
ncbi:MAG: hypothetical protein QOC92_4334 [Acidimicrobiaceae bacterium]